MNKSSLIKTLKNLMLFFISLTIISCTENEEPTPPDIPINQLLSAPDTISIDSRKIYLSTYMWRDFQPISPPDGKPLTALIYITAKDTLNIKNLITADALWIVYNNQVWKTWLSDEIVPENELMPNRIVKIARNGPKWGPNVTVDVIVRIFNNKGNSYLLKASNQRINRTD
ncbi:hypothetical protein [Rosettibacter firmus]|uniref:hypothetical protein n=1 Tax=Rosettibacter firmus TaxID=3111522 RepID=UPI00336BD261